MRRLRVGVLISGRGSNLQALIGACAAETYPAEIVLVISNRAGAPGLRLAAAAGIRAAVVPHRDRRAFADAAQRLLLEQNVELISLAGFMRILDTDFVEMWRDRMVNIHPSLLPAFRGLHAQRRALEAGVRFAGCTVHFVRPELDTGPIIGQAVVAVHPDDDESALSARILAVEHRLYPLALRLIAEGRVRVVAERVEVMNAEVPLAAVLNPPDCTGEALASFPA
ncbi:MAG: phosphoribosylglycinamide formyltransferase [Alphaproteobacteria bacterium]|nr:phosphoribosylglycinamide formyltransferase [Alphaproteobacteria bacterium]